MYDVRDTLTETRSNRQNLLSENGKMYSVSRGEDLKQDDTSSAAAKQKTKKQTREIFMKHADTSSAAVKVKTKQKKQKKYETGLHEQRRRDSKGTRERFGGSF
jgi:hypothetical protein